MFGGGGSRPASRQSRAGSSPGKRSSGNRSGQKSPGKRHVGTASHLNQDPGTGEQAHGYYGLRRLTSFGARKYSNTSHIQQNTTDYQSNMINPTLSNMRRAVTGTAAAGYTAEYPEKEQRGLDDPSGERAKAFHKRVTGKHENQRVAPILPLPGKNRFPSQTTHLASLGRSNSKEKHWAVPPGL